jgi:hypothetical protein
MTTASPQSPLAKLACEELATYFEHLAGRVESAVGSIPAESLWTKPFPFGNSVGHLVMHLTGNLNHYIGAGVAGSGYIWDRDSEFTDDSRPPADELLSRFREAVAMVVRTIHSQGVEGLMTRVADQPPIRSRIGLFLVCASHMNNHIGQMSYLVRALEPGTESKPMW